MKNMPAVLIVAALTLLAAHTAHATDTSFVYAKCNANCIPPGSPFWGNLGLTLHQIAENTGYAGFDFKTQNGGRNCPAYAQGTCSQSISPEDCTDCLTALSNHIWSICNDAIGAEVKFGDCCLRYEQYRF